MKLKEMIYQAMHKKQYKLKGTEATVYLYDIIIPKDFKKRECKPAKWKMKKVREFYQEHGCVDQPITVVPILSERKKDKYLLVDGYTRYLVLKENKIIKEIPVKFQDEYIM